jgi:hypothetical protein
MLDADHQFRRVNGHLHLSKQDVGLPRRARTVAVRQPPVRDSLPSMNSDAWPPGTGAWF